VTGSSSRTGRLAPVDIEVDAETRRRALLRALVFGVTVWTLFAATDFWSVWVIDPSLPLGWLLAWRVAGSLLLCLGFPLIRAVPPSWLAGVEWGLFFVPVLCICGMALRFYGLNCPYMQGISVTLAFQAALFPAPWRRALPLAAAMAAAFPVTMALAALVDEPVRETVLGRAHQVAFARDWVFVLATAAVCVLLAHNAWALQRQVYAARRLGRYRLKLRVGAGGSGEVWLATDTQTRRDVALKVLRPDAAARTGALARFEREATAVAQLHSPHTVRTFDFGASDDGVWYLAMEYLDGPDLRALVDAAGPLPPARAVHLARQVCRSLAEAHARGVVHRDVKPENVIVVRHDGVDDFVKVVDFGVAKVVDPEGDATLTQEGLIAGTPAYMAPETLATGQADVRADLYGVGGVLYYLLAGTPPLVHEAPSARRGEPLPAALEAVVRRCLERRPQDRYQSAEELEAALAATGAGEWTPADAAAAAAAQRPVVLAARRAATSPSAS
jgi:serine/threonine-protein kinase